jgi:hypothetical protein
MAEGSMNKLLEITSRLDHVESSAEWIARETIHSDSSVSQTGTLIMVLVDDLRTRVCALVKELEEISEDSSPIQ